MQIGGYHAGRDSVLVLDVARFKYPPHWVPLPALYAAMRDHTDPSNALPRGFMRLTAHAPARRCPSHTPAHRRSATTGCPRCSRSCAARRPGRCSASTSSRGALLQTLVPPSLPVRARLAPAVSFPPDANTAAAVAQFVRLVPVSLHQCVGWSVGMEPYTCCQAPDACSAPAAPRTVGQHVHSTRRAVLLQLHASPLHEHVRAALDEMGDHGACHARPAGAAEHADFVSMLLHALLLQAECWAIPLPRRFHINANTLGPDVRAEIEALQRQLRSAVV